MYFLLRVLGRMRFLRFGIRDRIIRFFANPDKKTDKTFLMPFFGLKYQGNLSDFIDWSVFFYGAYEIGILYLIRDVLLSGKNSVFLDIGANIGHHSLYASKYAKMVYSVEPYDYAYNKLNEKIVLNRIEDISVHPVAFGEVTERCTYYWPVGANQGTGSFLSDWAQNNNEDAGVLQVFNGDEYLAKIGLNQLDLLKLDVEGFEEKVFKGLKETIIKYRPVIIFEHSSRLFRKKPFSEFFPKGYRFFAIQIDTPRFFLFNCSSYILAQDINNITQNILAIPCEKVEALKKKIKC